MLESLRGIVEKFLSDPSVVVSAIYRVDGTPIVTGIKERTYIYILQWFEDQMRAVFQFILDGSLKEIEFKTRDHIVLLYPISRTIALLLVSTSEASIYKLKIDVESIKRSLNV